MLLIDVFNVLHLPQAAGAGVGGRSLDLAGLVGLLGASRYAGEAAVLYCDGSGDGSIEAPRGGDGGGKRGRVRLSGVEVVFSGPGSTADDEIEARLRRGGGHGMTVVSDDRRVRRAASRAGAKCLPSGVFLAQVLVPRAGSTPLPAFARDIPLDRYSVAHWMRAFGLTPGDLLEREGDVEGRTRGSAATPQKKKADRKAGGKRPPVTPPATPPAANEHPLAGEVTKPVLPERDLEEDPVIRAALEEWRGRLRVEDLEMGRWLEEH